MTMPKDAIRSAIEEAGFKFGRVAENVMAGNADGVVSQNFGAFSPGAVVENNG